MSYVHGESRLGKSSVTEWGVLVAGREQVEVCPSEQFARRYAANDPTARVVVSREVTEWAPLGESYGELADRMVREAARCPHPDFEDGACPECGSTDPDTACISHPDWQTEV